MAINTADLTEVSLTGEGILDVTMRTIELHLKREFDEGRIRGNDYAQTYTQLMAAALQSSTSYAMQKPLLEEQAKKGAEETALMLQKVITERAQTENLGDVDSVIGKQKTLYTEQAAGYIADRKHKAAKLFSDIAAVQLNINENYDTGTNGFDDANIKRAADNLLTEVGA